MTQQNKQLLTEQVETLTRKLQNKDIELEKNKLDYKIEEDNLNTKLNEVKNQLKNKKS